jgi:transcriptional regulator with XRE-family HTH domain
MQLPRKVYRTSYEIRCAVGALVKEARSIHGLTMRELAGTLEWSHSFIAQIESGDAKIPLDKRTRLFEALPGLEQEIRKLLRKPNVEILWTHSRDIVVDWYPVRTITKSMLSAFHRERLQATWLEKALNRHAAQLGCKVGVSTGRSEAKTLAEFSLLVQDVQLGLDLSVANVSKSRYGTEYFLVNDSTQVFMGFVHYQNGRTGLAIYNVRFIKPSRITVQADNNLKKMIKRQMQYDGAINAQV